MIIVVLPLYRADRLGHVSTAGNGGAGRTYAAGGCKEDYNVRSRIFRIIVVTLTTAVVSGCAADNGSPETAGSTGPAPGSVNVYLHGRTEVDIGASSR
jgi:hypothetical protein